MSLRYRLWLSFAPLLLLLAAFGAAAVYAFNLVGDRIDRILEANYRSVEAMAGLNESLERIDSAYLHALAKQSGAKEQSDAAWVAYRKHLDVERNNITEPGEAELVARLIDLTERYKSRGDRFFEPRRAEMDRASDYYGTAGGDSSLRSTFAELKSVTGEIRRLNQDGMERASAKPAARRSRRACGRPSHSSRRWAPPHCSPGARRARCCGRSTTSPGRRSPSATADSISA